MTRWRAVYGMTIAALLATGPAFAQHAGHGQHQEAHSPHKHGDLHKADAAADKEKKADKDAPAKLPLCPVMGEPVDFTVKTMTADGPVYFCCPMCIRKLEADPKKYAKKLAEQRKQLEGRERIQVACPISGQPIDQDVSVEQDGQQVYFCCPGCKPEYEADPEKHAAKLAASYTYQTHCPVMGGKINPTAFTDLPTGERIYFCCPGCDRKLLAEPAKYAENLEKQGIRIDVKKLKRALEKKDAGPHEEHADPHAGHGHS